MKTTSVAVACIALLASASATEVNPLGKVYDLMGELEAKIIKEGEAENKAYKEFFEWCDEASKNLNYEIKTGKAKQEKLTAKIGELSSDIEVADTKIEELSGAIAANEADLKKATAIRDKEAADFAVAEKELVETVDTLDRAISIIATETAKNPAALAQIDTSNMASLVQSLSVVVDAAGFASADKQKLVAFVQAQQNAEDGDADVGEPAAAAYKEHSGGIVAVLEDLKDKAESELAEARKTESTALHNFKMMKQSLEDQMAFDTKNMDEEKSAKEEAAEEKATAEGDLEVTVKALKESEEALAATQTDCMQTATDHEQTVAARKQELKVIAEAEKILKGSTEGAESQTYSFLQVSSSSKAQTRVELANSQVVTLVKKLARDHHSAALAQLASRIAVVMRYSGKNAGDPFKKVKGLIVDMIAKLEKEAESEATEKAYCDEEMAKTSTKKEDLESVIADLTAKIDKAAARSASLKEEVVELEKELVALAKEQAEMDKIRQEQHEAYVIAKDELEKGLAGVRKALDLLRNYYGNDAASFGAGDDSFAQQPAKPQKFEKSEGAGGSIIDILEVCESDFATSLAKEESEESDSAENYEKQTQENKVTKATKDQDVKYKTQEATALDKTISELTADKETSSTELAAVDEYFAKIKERCIAKPETYEERKARRDAEIEGLKEALSILENADAFVQVARKGGKSKHMMI